MTANDLKSFLDFKADLYNRKEFIQGDPISIPHSYSRKEDIEIAGFLTAVISWGQRSTIVSNARKLMHLMGYTPFEYVMNAPPSDRKHLLEFVHRTFNGIDCQYFVEALQNIYQHHGGLESIFSTNSTGQPTDIKDRLIVLKKTFFQWPHLPRTTKHLPDPGLGSAAKRMNLFLRWMVRKDNRRVDFGIWEKIPMSQLYCPLDVHAGNVARKIGLLHRKLNDWKAVEELTRQLRTFDPKDPVKYDYALFGMGVFENF